jgi:hypothetical protein
MSTINEIQETRNAVPTVERKLDRIRTRAVLFPEEIVLGRTIEEREVIDLVGHPHDDGHDCKVIYVWGMGGIGNPLLSGGSTAANSLVAGSVLGQPHCALSTVMRFFETWPCNFRKIFNKIQRLELVGSHTRRILNLWDTRNWLVYYLGFFMSRGASLLLMIYLPLKNGIPSNITWLKLDGS